MYHCEFMNFRGGDDCIYSNISNSQLLFALIFLLINLCLIIMNFIDGWGKAKKERERDKKSKAGENGKERVVFEENL